MHDAPHAQPVTQQSPSVVVPPGHIDVRGPSLQPVASTATNAITNVVTFSIVGLREDGDTPAASSPLWRRARPTDQLDAQLRRLPPRPMQRGKPLRVALADPAIEIAGVPAPCVYPARTPHLMLGH